MNKILLGLLVFFSTTCWGQKTKIVFTDDISNFWKAYDQVIKTKDSLKQIEIIQTQYIDKGTEGLQGIMKAKQYTALSYTKSINRYPMFWNSIRKNTLKANLKNNIMAKTAMKSYSLAEMKDKYIGKNGTIDREEYEYELRMDVLGRMIKTARQERKLTQEQLGELVGVQKAQISKLESSANSATIDTVLKVFKALKADIHFNVTLEKQYLQLV